MPTIVSLQDHLETIRQAEIDRVRGRLGPLSPEQELAVEALTRGIISKIMHTPISTLKTAVREPEATTVVDIVRRLFDLQDKGLQEKDLQGGGKTTKRRRSLAAENPEQKSSGPAAHRFPRIATCPLAGQSHQGAARATRAQRRN